MRRGDTRSTGRSGSCERRSRVQRTTAKLSSSVRGDVVTPQGVTRVGVAGLGYWGPNLARNFDDLAELAWLCDTSDGRRAEFAPRYPSVRVTGDFDEVLADDSLDAVVIATPVPTHYDLAKRALEAGKHVLVEKPPAMRAIEMDELVEIAA